MKTSYTAIIVAMVATVLFPQPGYIHPDEFFQSVEVVAGEIFNVSHYRAWEFNASVPIRDITLPYMLFGPGFYGLKSVMENLGTFGMPLPSLLIIVPRLTMTLLGLINFIFIAILSAECHLTKDGVFWFWVTSYVTWVHLTRTFSNTIETLLLSAVCVMIAKSSKYLESTVTKENTTNNGASGGIKKPSTRFSFMKFCVYCTLMGIFVCLGFFNRPTFLLFVFVPLLWWAQFLILSFRNKFLFAAITSCISAVNTFVCLTVVNTLYYEPKSRAALGMVFTSLAEGSLQGAVTRVRWIVSNCLRVPPWNFLQYNMQPNNLAQHGLHPWYTHLLLHLPSLLGPMVVMLYWNLLKFLFTFWRRVAPLESEQKLKQRKSFVLAAREGWLYMAVFLPVVFLSLFPHQEARFLLPIVPFAVLCAARNSITNGKTFTAFWLVFNILAFVTFGWVHQGGLVPALTSVSSELQGLKPEQNRSIHLVFYQTYMPPRHLLLHRNESVNAVTIHDVDGEHPNALQREISAICTASQTSRSECSLYFFVPESAVSDVSTAIHDLTQRAPVGPQVQQFCPHLSTEKLPKLDHLYNQLCLKVFRFSHSHLVGGDDRP